MVWHLPRSFLPTSIANAIEDIRIRSRQIYIPEPELGYVMRPGLDYHYSRDEFSFIMTTPLDLNGAGFRGGTLGGVPWAVAVGDSFTFGAGVDREFTWLARLSALARREFINLGVSGYGPQQYTRSLERYGLPLNPRIVLYCLFTNDLRDSLQFERRLREGPPRFSVKDLLQEYSVTYNLVHAIRANHQKGKKFVNIEDVGLTLSVRKLRDEIIEDSKRLPKASIIIEREIDRAVADSSTAKASFVLLYFPSKEEVYWDLIKTKIDGIEELDDRFDQLRKSTAAFCRSRRIRCLDLTPALRRTAVKREKVYFSIDSHWNTLGHEIVAEEVYRFLVDEALL